jgi:HK97 family phage major capsid protein
MKIDQLREKYAAKVSEARTLSAQRDEQTGLLKPEDAQKVEGLILEAKDLQKALDQALALEAADKYLNEPSEEPKAARHNWRGEALPDEGNIPGVSSDGKELFGYTQLGEQKLRAMKSGEYKDAMNAYVRASGQPHKLSPEHIKVLQEGQDTAGGFWVPVDQHSEVVKKQATVPGVHNNVKRYQVGTDVITFPKVVYTTDNKYAAGTRFSWTAEAPAADISEATNPVSGQISIPVNTATCAIILTRAQIEDTFFDILGYISDLMGETFGLGENDVIINGTGAGQPQGIQSHANATVAHASGGMQVLSGTAALLAWGTGGTTGILAQEAALPPQYESNAKWYGAKATYSAVRALNATTAGFQWNATDSFPNFMNGYAPSLLGYPIIKDEFMPAVGATAMPLMLGDATGYYAVERVGLSIEVLREVRALRDEVVVYARRRMGGQLVHDWKVKLLKSNNS